MRPLNKVAALLVALAAPAWALAQEAAASLPTEPADPNKITIGRLGQTVQAVEIRSNMDKNARVLSRAKAFQYVVINDTKFDAWKAVVLVNGRKGYIPAELVAELPYDVQIPKNHQLTSRSGTRVPTTIGATSTDKAQVLQESYRYIGTKYVWGGNSLTGGIDCSGFVKELYEGVGVNLPRTAREQAKVGQPVDRLEDLKPGDRLYFWDKKRGYIGHTGIFMGFHPDGGAYFIHSSSSRKGVAVDDLRNPTWRNTLVGARR